MLTDADNNYDGKGLGKNNYMHVCIPKRKIKKNTFRNR